MSGPNVESGERVDQIRRRICEGGFERREERAGPMPEPVVRMTMRG
jgi:hypothetical protein